MKRTLTAVGAFVIALVGVVAASQAQGRQGPPAAGGQRGDRPEIGCGPARGIDGQRPMQGAMRGRGQGMGRQGGLGRPGGPGRHGGRGQALCGLDLTADQKAQIKTIRQASRDEIEGVLTPEQREKLRARRGGR